MDKIALDNKCVDLFLDALRDSGRCNMFGAAPYISTTFEISLTESRAHLERWMKSFTRDPNNKIPNRTTPDDLESDVYEEFVPT